MDCFLEIQVMNYVAKRGITPEMKEHVSVCNSCTQRIAGERNRVHDVSARRSGFTTKTFGQGDRPPRRR